MEKREMIRRFAEEEEDLLLLARVRDKMLQTAEKNLFSFTSFLDIRQQAVAERFAAASGGVRRAFYGGPDFFERRVLMFFPEWMEGTSALSEQNPVALFRAAFNPFSALSPRDFLGALMGLGIRRESVGDIAVGEREAFFAVLRGIKPFVAENLRLVGRAAVSLSETDEKEVPLCPQAMKTLSGTVASLRLDSVVSVGFSLSREKASALISSGRVLLNHAVCQKPDREVRQADTVSSRGLGKFLLETVGKTTKKGRISITIQKHI